MKQGKKWCARIALSGLATLVLPACEAAQGADEPAIVSTEQPLIIYNPSQHTLWHTTNQVVKVCFHPDADDTPEDRTEFMNLMYNSWAKYSGLTFQDLGTCPTDSPNDYVPVFIKSKSGEGEWGGWGPVGVGARTAQDVMIANGITAPFPEFQLLLRKTPSKRMFKSSAVHEMGHVLGFMHEQYRDEPQNDCDLNAVETTGFITSVYDPDSIMNYCRDWDNSGVADGHGSEQRDFEELSDFDKLGIEVLYPSSMSNKRIQTPSSIVTSAGLLVRSDDVIMPEWLFRGASIQVYGPGIAWIVNGGIWASGASFPASSLATGTHSVTGLWQDQLGRTGTLAETSVVVDTSLHAAIASNVAF